MEKEPLYLKQLCEFLIDMDAKGITRNRLPEHLHKHLHDLRRRAMRQTGLTWKEMSIIVTYRRLGIPI